MCAPQCSKLYGKLVHNTIFATSTLYAGNKSISATLLTVADSLVALRMESQSALQCSKYWGHGYGWVLYFFLELFPITVMYLLVVIFHIRATSSSLSALVFMSQIVVYTIRLNVSLHMYIENILTGFPYVALKVLLVLCGICLLYTSPSPRD